MDTDDAVGTLIAEHGDRLLRVTFQLTNDRASAQDVGQEAIMRVWSSTRRRALAPDDLYAYVRVLGRSGGLRHDRADCQTAACESVISSGRNFLT